MRLVAARNRTASAGSEFDRFVAGKRRGQEQRVYIYTSNNGILVIESVAVKMPHDATHRSMLMVTWRYQ
jgi:hypothetical protein